MKNHHHPPSLFPRLKRPSRGGWVSIMATITMIALLTFATHPIAHDLSFFMVGSIVLSVFACSILVPGSLFFTLALANLIAIYSSLFIIILDSDFRTIEPWWQWLGFIAPLISFFTAIILKRKRIYHLINKHSEPNPAEYAHALLALLPLVFISGAAMIYASDDHPQAILRFVFLGAMGLASLIVFFASRDIVVFLLITGFLFESFFQRMRRMVAPVFAFFTFYSFIVLIFASIYAGIDIMTTMHHFRIHGIAQNITFPEALYFSLVTLATVGYGDIVPLSNIMRMISSAEVVSGILLLLFGFNEILSHTRDAHQRQRHEHKIKKE